MIQWEPFLLSKWEKNFFFLIEYWFVFLELVTIWWKLFFPHQHLCLDLISTLISEECSASLGGSADEGNTSGISPTTLLIYNWIELTCCCTLVVMLNVTFYRWQTSFILYHQSLNKLKILPKKCYCLLRRLTIIRTKGILMYLTLNHRRYWFQCSDDAKLILWFLCILIIEGCTLLSFLFMLKLGVFDYVNFV